MNRWLAEESKWMREQAVHTRTRISELSDPTWRTRRLALLNRESTELLAAVERQLVVVSEMELLQDPAALTDHLTRLAREVDPWEQLAAEQSARLTVTEAEQEALIP